MRGPVDTPRGRRPAPKPSQGGNALEDGYTTTERRPKGHRPGDMMPNAQADRVEERDARWGHMGMGESRRSRIYNRTSESDLNLPIGPLDDNEEYF